ncbi:MAG TPA: pyruvate dehydrogenase (acetyl-transferring) E1 component subunit alpha [Humibacter sp.]|nr:pyruvate dehydrogenase (acetyl-transferring) E1 component subunit alpha [Humibacter sp.]
MPTTDQGTELLTREERFTQLLTPDGERVADPDFDPWVSDVFGEQLLALYQDMVLVRRIDTEATALQRQGQLVLWPPLLGQEAAQVGSARALRSDDFVFPSYRENGVAYLRGAELTGILRPWRATSLSGWNPYDINVAVPAVIIGAQTLHAVGYAMGCQRDGTDSVSIAYFGDGATSEGDTNEAMIFAASYGAPVVFFCQNNHWAISEPVRLQAHRAIADRAPGFGIPSIRVDGNDVLAVMAVTRQALERARRGEGPTFIEAVTYRMGPHTTSDDPTRYRSKEELAEWAGRDPIARVERHLERAGVLTEELRAGVKATADDMAARLRSGCIALPKSDPMSMFNHVFVNETPRIARQRDEYAAFLAAVDVEDGAA